MQPRRGHRSAKGFTYLTVLFVVAILAGGLALVGEVWHTAALREKEAELLYVGNQYRKAIERYYLNGPRLYPRTLNDLLKDPRKPVTERYLRQIYVDPITGKDEWGLVKAPDGGIMGVHSLSDDTPLRVANFRPRDQEFEGAAKYSDWKFTFTPVLPVAPKPPAKAAITR
jgi:type II secretory pathway pseudopilin PulG